MKVNGRVQKWTMSPKVIGQIVIGGCSTTWDAFFTEILNYEWTRPRIGANILGDFVLSQADLMPRGRVLRHNKAGSFSGL